jgi:hypothetical protein
MQGFHRVVPLDLSAWTMDCVSEVVLFLEPPVPTKHGHLQSVHNIVLMVCLHTPATDVTFLTVCASERIECYRLDSL